MASKLSQMQARFQQRQMQEKEEKLLKLYENQQQRTIDRVSRGSAGSNGSLTNISTGKVRQMFDERRQKAGIDRSYPLEPLNKTMVTTTMKSNRTTSLDRKGLNPKTPTTKTTKGISGSKTTRKNVMPSGINNNNSKQFDEAESYLQEHEDLVRIMNKHNLSDSLEDEEMPRIGFDDLGYDDDIFTGKLANVGGKLPSQTVTINKSPPKKASNGTVRNGAAKPPLKKLLGGSRQNDSTTNRPFITKPSSPAIVKPALVTTTTRSASSNNNTRSESSSSGNSSKESTPAGSPAKMSRVPHKGTSHAGDVRSPSSARHSARPLSRPSVQRDDLTSCRYCQRRFATDRIQTHEDICSRTAKKKRKTYDSTKHRLAGTEIDPIVKKGTAKSTKQSTHSEKVGSNTKQKTSVQSKATTSKTDWRQKHEEFIAAIRAAKEAQAHLAKGGNIRDLPPPPPSSNPDYVQCPHCGRRFNESAAERHIPKCATYDFNKPKPKTRK